MSEARIYDVDIGNDPDDTCVAVMLARAPARFQPTLVITNDETLARGRARFLSGLLDATLVVAGLPSVQRRDDTLVERAGLVPADVSVATDGVERLIDVLERHDRTLYFGLGALTNLATALALRPDLASRIELVQMGPAFADLEPRVRPQYNARLDPVSFVRVLAAVSSPSLLLSHVSWARFPSGRHEIGLYPDDPLGRAVAAGSHPSLRALARHLAAWVASGKPCSILHDPLTVLSRLEDGLVEYRVAEIVVGPDGTAVRAPATLAGGVSVRAKISHCADYRAARRAITAALFPTEGAAWSESLAERWGEYNASRGA
jgi:Inosine-uridine preferring nucleoside hydrolase